MCTIGGRDFDGRTQAGGVGELWLWKSQPVYFSRTLDLSTCQNANAKENRWFFQNLQGSRQFCNWDPCRRGKVDSVAKIWISVSRSAEVVDTFWRFSRIKTQTGRKLSAVFYCNTALQVDGC